MADEAQEAFEIDYIEEFITEGLQTDGEDHKQWYLEQILVRLGASLENLEYKPGVAP